VLGLIIIARNYFISAASFWLELKEIFYLVLSHPLWQSGSYENYYQSSHENRI